MQKIIAMEKGREATLGDSKKVFLRKLIKENVCLCSYPVITVPHETVG
jgi:hypothetical protein